MPVFRKEGGRAHETQGHGNAKKNIVLPAESEMRDAFSKANLKRNRGEALQRLFSPWLYLFRISHEFGTVKIMSYVFQCLLIGN